MNRTSSRSLLLTHAVLASTLFISTSSIALTISVPTANPVATSAAIDKTIQILAPNGSVSGVANQDGIQIDSAFGKLIIDPNNSKTFNTVETSGANQVAGVLISQPNATVTVGANSGINNVNTNLGSNTIVVVNNASNANITNSGTIQNAGVGAATAINFNKGLNGIIVNNAGGLIQSLAGASEAIFVSGDSDNITIRNTGVIKQLSNFDTIQLEGTLLELTNHTGGIITNSNGGPGQFVLNIMGGGSGNITNQAGAVISATTAGTGGITINNADFDGSIINAGSISTIGGQAIVFSQNINGTINNSGSIVTNTPATATILAAAPGLKVTGGIINSGTIQAKDATTALNLTDGIVTFTQSKGTIIGNVLLADRSSENLAGGQKLFFLNGGIITGSVIAGTSANVGDFNILELKSGILAGALTLGNNGDTVNLSDVLITGGLIGGPGNDTVNVTGGSFGFLDGGLGLNTLNVNATFSPIGTIDKMGIIHVQNPGTVFTLNSPINTMDNVGPGLTIDAGTKMVLNANISGSASVINNGLLTVSGSPVIDLSTGPSTVTNNGTTQLGSAANLTVTSNVANAFNSTAGSTLKIDIAGLTSSSGTLSHGKLTVNSAQASAVNLAKGSFVQPIVTGFIPQGSKFDIVTVNGGGTILANDTLKQPSSAVISFSQSLNLANNILSLTTLRKSYEFLSLTQVTQGIAGALDALAQGNGPSSPQLLNLLAQLDQLGSAQAVEEAMESLAPPFNYGLIAGSHIIMDNTFEGIQSRLEDLRKNRKGSTRLSANDSPIQLAANGVNYGDLGGSGSVWGKLLGAHLSQKERGGVPGYRAKAAGVALGADWGFNDCTTFGLAASYAKVNVDDKNPSPKDQSIKSWQGTAYGWWEFCDGWYLDAMAGIGSNHYKLNRVINVNTIHTAANSSFNGTQYGAQADLGWSFLDCDTYYVAPFARLKYIHLNLDDYAESGAGDLSLDVQNRNAKEFLGGIGFKVGSLYQACEYLIVPELTAMIGYDFTLDGEQPFAGFIGGGPFFVTDGIKPGRTVFDLGLGVNAHICNNAILGLKYNLELRSKFVGNALQLQYNYFWC